MPHCVELNASNGIAKRYNGVATLWKTAKYHKLLYLTSYYFASYYLTQVQQRVNAGERAECVAEL